VKNSVVRKAEMAAVVAALQVDQALLLDRPEKLRVTPQQELDLGRIKPTRLIPKQTVYHIALTVSKIGKRIGADKGSQSATLNIAISDEPSTLLRL
jgi:hypothetical protein